MQHHTAIRARLSLLALLLGLLALIPVHAQTPSGRFDLAIGRVEVVSAAGETRQVRRGSPVYPGDTVRTARGRAQLRMTDGSRVSLVEQTDFEIQEYEYDSRAGSADRSRSFFGLIRGGVRVLTGLIGKRSRENWRMRTPVATIGIRGTFFFARFENDILLVSVSDQALLAEQGVVVSNAFGSAPAGAGENIQVIAGQAPQLSDLQAGLGFIQPGDLSAALEEAGGRIEELRTIVQTGEIRNGNDLAITPTTTETTPTFIPMLGSFASNLFLNATTFTFDDPSAPSIASGICCENDNVVLTRGTATLKDAQSGDGWVLFAWEAGTYTVDFTKSAVDLPGFNPPFTEGLSTKTLVGPHQRLNFAMGTPTTALTAVSGVFVDFNNVLATLPVTSWDGAVLDQTGGVIAAGTNVFWQSSTNQLFTSPMNVRILGDVVGITGSASVLPAFGGGFVLLNPSFTANGSIICPSTCGAFIAGGLLGNGTTPNGRAIPTGVAVNAAVFDTSVTYQTAAILGMSNVSEP
ncbi:MAG: FecR domain-containing protein [Gammaproteobacteria bacterium]|nr:FecR domain-containing protein [Gammaproteobacteria bacterium]